MALYLVDKPGFADALEHFVKSFNLIHSNCNRYMDLMT